MTSSKAAGAAPDWTVGLSLNVVFTFDEQWEIGPASGATAARLRFPPGGGTTFTPPLRIGPVHLQGLSADEVAKIVHKRAEDMATLAEAVAAANIQFKEALDSIARPAAAPTEPKHDHADPR